VDWRATISRAPRRTRKQQRTDLVICERTYRRSPAMNRASLQKLSYIGGIPFILLTKEKPPLAEMEHAGFRIFSDDYLRRSTN
jgi:hypothetical protein